MSGVTRHLALGGMLPCDAHGSGVFVKDEDHRTLEQERDTLRAQVEAMRTLLGRCRDSVIFGEDFDLPVSLLDEIAALQAKP